MPWEIRRGKPRFVDLEQVCGKTYKIYHGAGERGRLAEQAFLQKREAIRREKQAEHDLKIHFDQYETTLQKTIVESLFEMGCVRHHSRRWSYPRNSEPPTKGPDAALRSAPILSSFDEKSVKNS